MPRSKVRAYVYFSSKDGGLEKCLGENKSITRIQKIENDFLATIEADSRSQALEIILSIESSKVSAVPVLVVEG